MSPKEHFYVRAARDAEAGVWYVAETNIPGLNVEADTPQELMDVLSDVIPELLVANGVLQGNHDLPEVPYSLMYDSLQAGHAHQ